MTTSVSDDSRTPRAGLFQTTLWTVVVKAGSADAAESQMALEQLCRAYWYPIYAHIRRRGRSPADAEDLVQAFFAALIARCRFAELSAEKGRFRSYLLAALANFLADEWDRAGAARRGGGKQLISLDEQDAEGRLKIEPAAGRTPEAEFDRRWAETILQRALEKLADDQARAGKQESFELLRGFLADYSGAQDYAGPAAAMKISSNAVAAAVMRLRQRYRECVREEVANTLADSGDTDAEMKHLMAAMRG